MFTIQKLKFTTPFMENKASFDNSEIIKMVNPFKGTTTLAFIFKHGIVIAVDSRATSGQYISSRSVHKVIHINKFLLSTMAGGAADCLFWEKRMGSYAKYFELTYGRRISVASAVNYLRRCIVRKQNLSIGSMVCGWDQSGPNIYLVDNSGTMIKGECFSVGSGSTIAYGVLTTNYRFDMEKEEALKLGRNAIFHAMHRDAYSGGSCNLYFMDQNGWDFIGEYEFNSMYAEIMVKKSK